MDKQTEQRYWQEAYRRFLLANWESPITQAEVDEFHATLPPRQQSETINAWLKRVLNPKRLVVFTELIRRVARSDSEEYPLPDKELRTKDGKIRFNIFKESDKIVISVKVFGSKAIKELANCELGLVDKNQEFARIQLDDNGHGEIRLNDNPDHRKALANPLIGRYE